MASGAFWTPFAFRFKSVQAIYNEDHPETTDPGNLKFWYPPTQRARFEAAEESLWTMWAGRGSQIVQPHSVARLIPYRKSSIFWADDHRSYLHCPKDCAEEDLTDEPEEHLPQSPQSETSSWPDIGVWKRLTFKHRNYGTGRCISKIGYGYEDYKIGTVGPERWFEKLLQRPCQGIMSDDYVGECTLAGDLSLLVGLAASCLPWDEVQNVGFHSFRPEPADTTFQPHGLWPTDQGERWLPRRGVVVEIAFDPRYTSAEHLEAWENGEYGPILT